jgi:hypothetical protein
MDPSEHFRQSAWQSCPITAANNVGLEVFRSVLEVCR